MTPGRQTWFAVGRDLRMLDRVDIASAIAPR